MISLLSLVTVVAVELPVIVQTVFCSSVTALVLFTVEITPLRVDPSASNVVLPPPVVLSRVLLFAVAVVLVRPILAMEPCTENEASLAMIVPLLYASVLAAPPLLNRKPMPPFPAAVTRVPVMVRLPPFCSRPPTPLLTETEPPVVTMVPLFDAFTPALPPLPVTLTTTLSAITELPAPVDRSPVSPPPIPLTDTLPPVSVTWPPVSAFAPTSLPPLPTEMLTPLAVMVLPAPVAERPVFPPPPENAMLPPVSSIAPPA